MGPGDILAERYALEGLIGRGGMAAVYRARDQRSGKPCAVKLVTLGDDAEVVRHWFARELRALMAIDHPAVLRLNDYGETSDGDLFVVTELLEGVDLDTAVRQTGAMPEDVFVQVALQACRGLKASHDIGVAHRDLKPANLFLTAAARVVVLDFGLARATTESSGRTLAQGMGTKLIGTPFYMAPEQVEGVSLSLHSDLFSLGSTFYYLLVGAIAFTGQSSLEVLTSIAMNRRRYLKDTAPKVSLPVRDIVEKMLAPKPEERPATIDEVIAVFARAPRNEQLLEAYASRVTGTEQESHTRITAATTAPVTPPVQTRSSRRRWPVALGVAALAGLGVLFLRPTPTPRSSDSVAQVKAPGDAPPAAADPVLPAPAAAESIKTPDLAAEPDTTTEKARGTLLCTMKQWAEVSIDGKSIGRKQNAVQVELPAGKHKIELRNPKYPAREIAVTIRKKAETHVDVDLANP